MTKSIWIVFLAFLGLGVIVLGFVAFQLRNQSMQEFARAATAEAQAESAHATADTARADAAAAHATADAAETASAASVENAQSVRASASATADANQANARQTEQAAQAVATTAAVRETEQAQILACDKPIDLTLIPENQTYFKLLPRGAEAAIPLDEKGIKPLSIKAQDSVLFHYHPSTDVEVYYVKCLFFQVYFLNSDSDEPPSFDFSLWHPAESGWSINGGKNKLGSGQNLIEIVSPDDVVSREGDIYLSLRDYGTSKATILKMGFTLVLVNRNGTERTIRSTVDSTQ
jgi:hypothetical protein